MGEDIVRFSSLLELIRTQASGAFWKVIQELLIFYHATCMHSADYAITRCLSVRHMPVTSIPSKWLHLSLDFFSLLSSQTILIFPYQNVC